MEGNCSYKDRLIGFIADYEEVLLGKKGKYSFWYCTGNAEYDEKLALDVMRYAFEKLLKWTPEMINECKDIAVLEKMKLYYIYKQKIIHPYRKTQFSIFNLIAAKMYPDKITLDGKSNTISIYKKVLSGEYVKFPKNFFSTTEGILKFGYCLRYALTEIIGFTSAKELYDMFSEPSIKTVLEKIKLLNVYSLFFETPVDMLHYCIPKALRDDDYYIICKQKYLKKRLSCGTGLRYVRQYHRYLYCQDSYNPLTGLGEEYREEPSRIIFYYVLTELLPADPALKYEEYDYQDRNTLYCIMTRYDIDYLLDKYRIRDLVRRVSDNYVDAADMLLYGDTRDETCYKYASRKFASANRAEYKELPMSVRRYLAVLKGRISIEMAIHNREQLVECLDYLWDYVLPFSDTYSADDISSLLTDKDFLTEYKLNDVIAYL
ncbi:MAG: hypothetical protein IK990_07035 [Ruminiclostridium sp.]|nr:hypothetical protein [Ruminococcus sp.]MBP3855345.1 hypothetical protein [Ruminiclostridium sp.]